MVKKGYIARLERWARWYLPRAEAEDVIADYRDIVGDPPRSDEELRQDLGRPRDVVKPLTQPKRYRVWLAVFTVMAACILAPAASQFYGAGPLFLPYFPWAQLFLLAGTALVLVWARSRKGRGSAPLPRAIPITLAILLASAAFSWWVFWQISLSPGGALANPIFHLPASIPIGRMSWTTNLFTLLLTYGLLLPAAAGMTGLVRARLGDRRWLAVYMLSLSALLLALRVLAVLTNMDPTATLESMLTGAIPVMIEITLAGLLGTGVALC